VPVTELQGSSLSAFDINSIKGEMIMNEIVKVFENEEFGRVRTVTINNEPWFVGKDVTEILGYERTTKAVVEHVDDEDRQMVDGRTQSYFGIELGQRGGWLINESGLYGLILSSKLPKAKDFKHWVTSEVLPSIRKTGSYSIQPKPDSYMIEDPVERAKRWIEEYEERKALEQKIELDKPKVDFADHVSDTSDLIDIGTLAKLANDENIPIGRNKLFEWLRTNYILMSKGEHKNEPYQKCIDNGWFVIKEYAYKTPYGNQIGTKTYVTGKGQMYIIERLRKEFT
jgi:Prophage antirepressor